MQQDMPFPLLLDPDHTLRRLLGIGLLTNAQSMGLRSSRNYANAMRGGVANGRVIRSERLQTPVVLILGADQSVVWKFVGTAVGDYPTVDEVLAQIPSDV